MALDALSIAAGPPKMKAGDSLPESEGGAKVRAARRLRQALAGKDDGAIASAFKTMYDLCASHGPDDEIEELPDDGGGEEDY